MNNATLKKLGVQEISKTEQANTNGGAVVFAIIAYAATVGAYYAAASAIKSWFAAPSGQNIGSKR